jgi:hypothetical protein
MFTVGQRVKRLEDGRTLVDATILTIDASGMLELQYDEGGTGWWPPECVAAI